MNIRWFTGAALLVSTGGLVACGAADPTAGASSAPPAVTSTAPGTAPSDDATTGSGPAPTRTSAAPAVKDPILRGDRQFAIVRTQAAESAVSLLDNGKLAEVDDDSGKTLFVLSPVGGEKYLIRTAELDKATHGSQACWQVRNPGNGSALTVQKAACDPDSARQQFTIAARKKSAYAISNSSVFLQYSPASGLILEELGDATLTTTFTFVDNGPAPAVD